MLREGLSFERLSAMDPGEAAALFVARRAEGLTASEEDLLATWLTADDTHAGEFSRAQQAWDSFTDADNSEILAAMREQALAARTPRRWLDWRYATAAAAALVLIVAASVVMMNRQQPTPAAIQYAAAHGQVRPITLADGSVMTLDADSAASVRFGEKRLIHLERGRALFEVAHDSSRPFEVTATDRRIVAVGTRFEVDIAPGVLKVALLEGRISVGRLDGNSQPLTLRPGQQFVERGAATTIRSLGTGGGATGWRRGLLDFDDEPLAEAVVEVNRYAGDQLIILDPTVAAMRISGQFRAGEAERFARTVSEIHPVRVVRRGNRIELVPAE